MLGGDPDDLCAHARVVRARIGEKAEQARDVAATMPTTAQKIDHPAGTLLTSSAIDDAKDLAGTAKPGLDALTGGPL